MTQWIDAVPAAQLDPGRCRVVDIDDVAVALYNIDGSFYAIEDTCTHDGGELASGELDGDVVICPRHGARFCIRTPAKCCAPRPTRTSTATRCASSMAWSRSATNRLTTSY